MPKLTKGLQPGDADRTIITAVKRTVPVAERTPACLLDPLHWATRPEDRARGPMPAWELEYRIANRRPVFTRLLKSIEEECDAERIAVDWHIDEAFHSYRIPREQLELVEALLPEQGFGLTTAHNHPRVPLVGVMITDLVVGALRPEDYNCFTLRGANADGVPLVLLDPAYWKTNPDDYVMNGYVDGEEYAYRLEHRRIEFTRLLSDLEERFDLSEDDCDWGIDESFDSYFIPLSQVADAHKLITDRGFDYEESENIYGDNDDETNLWVQDPVVRKLMPQDYNRYTMRSQRRRP